MVCHRKATGDSKGQRARVAWTSESFSAGSLGPSGLCVYFSLHISFILLSLEHLVIGLACGPILAIPQHSLTDGIPIPTPQEEGSDELCLGQVSPTGPTGCLKGGHGAGKGLGGLALGKTGVLRAGGPHVV